MSVIRAALRGLWARKRRFISACLAIVLGTAFMTGTHAISADLRASVDLVAQRSYENYDAVVQSPHSQRAAFGQILRDPVGAEIAASLESVPGVAEAQGIVETTSTQVFGHRGGIPNRRPPTLMVNWVGGPLQQDTIVQGRPPSSDSEVVLDVETAAEVELQLGRDTVLIGPDGRETFELVGLTGLEDEPTRSGRGPTIVVTTSVAQRHARHPGSYSYIAVAGSPDLSSEELVERLHAAVPNADVLTRDEYAAQRADGFSWFADVVAGFVAVFGFISLFVAAFIVHNTFSILLAQRVREHALMRALGAESRQVLVASLVEAAIVGVFSSLIGLFAGMGLAAGLRSVVGRFFSPDPTTLRVPLSVVPTALAVGVGVALLSVALPAWRASRVPPVAAMADAEANAETTATSRGILGFVVLVIAVGTIGSALTDAVGSPLVRFGIGAALVVISASLLLPHASAPASRLITLPFARAGSLTARVAGENSARNPRRTAVAAVSLTVGVMLVSLIAVVASSVRSEVHDSIAGRVSADFVVRTSSFASGVGVPAGHLARIADMDSVEVVSPIRFGGVRIPDDDPRAIGAEADDRQLESPPDGDDVAALGIYPNSFFDVVNSGKIQGSLSELKRGSFAVARRFAVRHGWSVGDQVAFYFPRTGVQRLELAAIVDMEFLRAAVLLPRTVFDANMLPTFAHDSLVLVRADPSASADRVAALRTALTDLFAAHGSLAVEDLAEYVASRTAPLDTFLVAVYGLLGLAVVIALLGIANTLSLSILERRRELGVMRALGMTRGQIRRTILWESTIIALIGTFLGLAMGLALSFALLSVLSASGTEAMGWDPPVRMLSIVAGAAVLAGIAASVAPAWRASRSGPLEAMGAL